VTNLKTGNLHTRIEFREKHDMEDLTHECNALVDFYRDKFVQINDALLRLEQHSGNDPKAREQIEAIKQTLQKVHFN
jgi:hypothetical protein